MDTLYYRGKPVRIVVDTKVIELDELQFYMANEVASISFFKDASEVPFFMPVRNGDQMEKMDEYKGVILIELKMEVPPTIIVHHWDWQLSTH